MQFIGTLQLMFYAMFNFGMKAHILRRKNLAALLLARKLTGLIVNYEKIQHTHTHTYIYIYIYIFIPGKQNTG